MKLEITLYASRYGKVESIQMAIGEKLFEDVGKVTGISIKSSGPEGITLEANVAGEVKGVGRLQGLKGRYFGTGTQIQSPSGPAKGDFTVLVATEDGSSILMVGRSSIIVEGGKQNGVSLVKCSTTSQKYAWMNTLIFLREDEGSLDTQTSSGSTFAWK